MERSARRPWWLTLGVAGVGLGVTLWVAADPPLRLASRSKATHLVLETGDAVVAGIVALLVYGRFRRSRAAADLFLSYAMALLTLAGLGFVTIPELSGLGPTDPLTSWAPLLLRVVAAGLLAAGAVLPTAFAANRKLLSTAVLVAFVVAVVVVVLTAPRALPVAVEPILGPGADARVVAHPAVLAVEGVDLLLYAIACVAYTYRASRTNDDFVAWIGAAAGISALARVDYLIVPTLFSDYVYVGDVMRTASYVFLLVAAVREIEHYWTAIAAGAALQERQRIARDLHDGLAQELIYIWSQVQELERRPPDQRDIVQRRLSSASARAIDEARRAIAALTQPSDEPLADALARSAEEVAHRYGADLELDIDDGVDVAPDVREAMIRIMREAISNSARHSGAGRVTVRLCSDEAGVKLVVADCGKGFDAATAQSGHGFGLTSMRQRAEASGGRFDVASPLGDGVTVVVVWP